MSNGELFLVATPIGNLKDISFRAIETLKEVDIIACEDTRHTLKLLNHYDIKKRLESYHEHNKYEKGEKLIQWLLEGYNIALVTDAGTPGISDPGEDIVREAIEAGIKITLIPGPVAGIVGLVLSGLSTKRFVFEGFLPSRGKEKKDQINALKDEERTIVLYEAPHRLKDTLIKLFEVLGDRKITLARELTKHFEEIKRFSLEDACDYYSNLSPKGEFVLVIEGANPDLAKEKQIQEWESISVEEHYEHYLKKGFVRNEAIKQVARDRGVPKREIYNYISKKA